MKTSLLLLAIAAFGINLTQAQKSPRCFADTFDGISSLENWRVPRGQAEVTEGGTMKLSASNIVPANFQSSGGGGDFVYDDFHFSVELEYVSGNSNDSAVFARGQVGGLGSYIFFLNNGSELQIMRISQGGGFNIIGSASIDMPSDDWLRYEFVGKGANLTGRAYSLNDPDTPLGEVTSTDSTYSNGRIGFTKIDGPSFIEFDNFKVFDPNDPSGCDEQQPEPPVCFTDTFDDDDSLPSWQIGQGGNAAITDDGEIRLTGASLVSARFQDTDGEPYLYSDFHFTVDMEYKNTTPSDSGVFARGSTDNLGSYLLYFNNGSALQILRIPSGGGFTSIGFESVSLPSDVDWIRYEFTGNASELTGRVYTLDNLTEPFGEVTVTDDVYPTGTIGLVGLDNGVDVRYDNFRVLDPSDPNGCNESNPEQPLCLTNTFDDDSSLTDWAVHKSFNEMRITDEGTLLIEGGNTGGAFPTEAVVTDFQIEVDLNYVGGGGPDYGAFARITRHSNETADGYFFLINNGNLQILRLQNDQPVAVVGQASPSQTLESGWLRLVFTGIGDQLTGRVYSTDQPDALLGEVSGTDSTYNSGLVLLGGSNASGFRAEYDNLKVLDPEEPDGCGDITTTPPVFTITASASPAEGGTIEGAGEFPQNTSVTLTATPHDWYLFKHWEGEELTQPQDASMMLTVTENQSVTAVFVPLPPAEPLEITNLMMAGDRSLRIEIMGSVANKDYVVQSSRDLQSWSQGKRFQGSSVEFTTEEAESEYYRVAEAAASQ